MKRLSYLLLCVAVLGACNAQDPTNDTVVEPPKNPRLLWNNLDRASSYGVWYSKLTGSELADRADAYASDGFAITSMIYNPSTGYHLFGQRVTSGRLRNTVEQVAGKDLEDTVTRITANGQIVTAASFNAAGFTIFASSDASGAYRLSSRVEQVRGTELEDTVADLSRNGFVITGAVDANGYTLIAQRNENESVALASRVVQVGSTAVSDQVDAFSDDGFVIVGLVWNSAGYTMIGQRATVGALVGRMGHLHSSQLADELDDFGANGFQVIAADSTSAGHTMIGQR